MKDTRALIWARDETDHYWVQYSCRYLMSIPCHSLLVQPGSALLAIPCQNVASLSTTIRSGREEDMWIVCPIKRWWRFTRHPTPRISWRPLVCTPLMLGLLCIVFFVPHLGYSCTSHNRTCTAVRLNCHHIYREYDSSQPWPKEPLE